MQKLILLAVFLKLFLPASVHAEEVNAGFVQGLWYSEENVLVGEPTRIYVALRNNTEHDLTGTVRFTIDGTRIGSSEVRALSGRLVEAWVDWTPEFGSHTVSARMSDAELHIIGEGTQRIDITSMIAEDTLFVDLDTDGDGVGNQEDTDDDNDGISDVDEEAGDTDPLTPDATQMPEPESSQANESEEQGSPLAVNSTTSELGLERFLSEGTADSILNSVTKQIEDTKQSLDTYREKRIEKLAAKNDETEINISLPNGASTTITRTNIEPNISWFEKFIKLASSLISTLWSFTLVFFSFILGFPALIELMILWGILVFIYRTAKRLGQRRNK